MINGYFKVDAPRTDAMHADPIAALDALEARLACCYTRYIALCCPAPRKPGVYLHVHPFGGAKPCFTTRAPPNPCTPARRSEAVLHCKAPTSPYTSPYGQLCSCAKRLPCRFVSQPIVPAITSFHRRGLPERRETTLRRTRFLKVPIARDLCENCGLESELLVNRTCVRPPTSTESCFYFADRGAHSDPVSIRGGAIWCIQAQLQSSG
jgi:hypothetical protein